MDIAQEDLDSGVHKVTLNGSFDIAGAGDVDAPFSDIGGTKDKVLVDFSGVDFLASIGIRTIVKAAKAMGTRGGKMAIVNPNDAARRVLSSTGVDSIVTVVDDEAAAVAALT
ncbi:MAG: STAS domain-containing protein [Pseudomonadota bacterium]